MALGEILRAEREKQGYTLSQVAQNTNLLVQVVEALENEDFRRIAAAIYGRGFVRLYADFLGLDPVPLVQDFMALYDGAKPPIVRTRAQAVSASPQTKHAPVNEAPAPEDKGCPVKIRSAAVSPSGNHFVSGEATQIDTGRPIVRGRRVMPPARPTVEVASPRSPVPQVAVREQPVSSSAAPSDSFQVHAPIATVQPISRTPVSPETSGTLPLQQVPQPASSPEARPPVEEKPVAAMANAESIVAKAPEEKTAPAVKSTIGQKVEPSWKDSLRVPQKDVPPRQTSNERSLFGTTPAPAVPPPVPSVVDVHPQHQAQWEEKPQTISVSEKVPVPAVTGVHPLSIPREEKEAASEPQFRITDRTGEPIFSKPVPEEPPKRQQIVVGDSDSLSNTEDTQVHFPQMERAPEEKKEKAVPSSSVGDDRQPDLFDMDLSDYQKRAAEEERARAERQRKEEEEERKDVVRFSDKLSELWNVALCKVKALPDALKAAYAHSRQIFLAAGALVAVLLLAFGVYTLFTYSERLMEAELPRPGEKCIPPCAMYVD